MKPHLFTKLLAALVVCATVVAAPRPAAADTEWVLMLDNSSSMSGPTPYSENGVFVKNIPAQDPDRLAVIATLVFRALMGPDDKLTILTFDSRHGPGKYTLVPNDPPTIRKLFFGEATFMVAHDFAAVDNNVSDNEGSSFAGVTVVEFVPGEFEANVQEHASICP